MYVPPSKPLQPNIFSSPALKPIPLLLPQKSPLFSSLTLAFFSSFKPLPLYHQLANSSPHPSNSFLSHKPNASLLETLILLLLSNLSLSYLSFSHQDPSKCLVLSFSQAFPFSPHVKAIFFIKNPLLIPLFLLPQNHALLLFQNSNFTTPLNRTDSLLRLPIALPLRYCYC